MKIFQHRISKLVDLVLMKYGAIDIIHAHSVFPAGAAAIEIGKKHGIPVFVTEHASKVLNKNLNTREIDILKRVVSSSCFFSVSTALRRSISEMIGLDDRIVVLPNMVSSSFIEVPQVNFQPQGKKFEFLVVSNCKASKRWDLALSAFAKAFPKKSNIMLSFCGDGPELQNIKKQVFELGLDGRVEFLGLIKRENVPSVIAQCDAFLLPSDFETFGVVYIEAMACGKPVIGTMNGGAEDIITPEVGLLVPKGDDDALALAMRKIYENRFEYSGDKIRQYCIERYSELVVARKLEASFIKSINK
jgi:glycosyltransferase involved in cell wall biosynthesis